MKIGNCFWAAFVWLSLGFGSAYAGSATWLAKPASDEWNKASNWMPETVPNGPADVATFGISNQPSITISSDFNQQVTAIRFNAGASPFTITVVEQGGSCCFLLTFSGVGVVNDSGTIQTFVANSAFNGHGQFRFTNNATAGASTVFISNGAGTGTFDPFTAGVEFHDMSSADYGVFINNPGSGTGGSGANPGYVSFQDNATAGHGSFTNNGAGFNIPGSTTYFLGNASAGEGSFVNNGATAGTSQHYNGGFTLFRQVATAANAIFINNGALATSAIGGGLGFYENSTAATATVTNNPGGENGGGSGNTGFNDQASADRANLTNKGCATANQAASELGFSGHSTAASSTITNDGGIQTDALGGRTDFVEHATADNSTVFANEGLSGGQGGSIDFTADSSGGTARIVVLGNGSLMIAAHNAPGVTIGSLEGSGHVFLGSNNLTVGSRDNSTGFSGVIQDGGSLNKIGAGTLTLSGSNTYTGATSINAGRLIVNGSVISAATVNSSGTLGGSGTTGSVTVNSGGAAAPSGSQTLHISGNYAQNAGGVLKIEIAGIDPSASGRLDITGGANVDGTLEVRFVNGFLPSSGQVFKLIDVAGAFAGSFAQIIFPDLRAGFQFQAEFVNGSYQITALNDGGAATGFLNISTRMQVGTGDNALIGGFIVTGIAPKKVIIRAVGPSLAPLSGRLMDPTLELRDSGGELILSNDNWMEGTQAQEIIDTGIPPNDEHEAAIVATLAPGSYTAVMRGVGNTTGIGVVEVYDLATEVSAKLANISSRGFVDIDDNVMIGGFIAGNQATHVIVRAIGPSLTQSGVPNALADPMLELHDAQGAVIASNDDWRQTNEAAIETTGIPPTDDKESAILATLAPGNYTAIVRGKNDSTGVGLIEFYDLN